MKTQNRPISYCCYLCGQQFGSQSLYIHIGNCQKKWLKYEETKPKAQRRPLPPPPEEIANAELPKGAQAIEQFNNKMFQYFNEISLVRCSGCNRTFNQDAIEKHMQRCVPLQQKPGGNMTNGGGFNNKPRGYTCYICGQQYGSKSLQIHIPQCEKKWLQIESKKPKSERRPLPKKPEGIDGALPTDAAAVDKFNEDMYKQWDQEALITCTICTRSFNPEAFEKHQKVCTPSNPGGPLGLPKNYEERKAQQEQKAQEQLEAKMAAMSADDEHAGSPTAPKKRVPMFINCYLCGQQFGSGSLMIHIPQCQKKEQKRLAAQGIDTLLPDPPAELDHLPTTPDEAAEFNTRMLDIFNNTSLYPCPHCGRTFNFDALQRHQKMCTRDKPMPAAAKKIELGGSLPAQSRGGGGGFVVVVA